MGQRNGRSVVNFPACPNNGVCFLTVLSFTGAGDPMYQPIFREEVTLTLDIDGLGRTDPVGFTHAYYEEQSVTLTATPEPNWQFDQWNGPITSQSTR